MTEHDDDCFDCKEGGDHHEVVEQKMHAKYGDVDPKNLKGAGLICPKGHLHGQTDLYGNSHAHLFRNAGVKSRDGGHDFTDDHMLGHGWARVRAGGSRGDLIETQMHDLGPKVHHAISRFVDSHLDSQFECWEEGAAPRFNCCRMHRNGDGTNEAACRGMFDHEVRQHYGLDEKHTESEAPRSTATTPTGWTGTRRGSQKVWGKVSRKTTKYPDGWRKSDEDVKPIVNNSMRVYQAGGYTFNRAEREHTIISPKGNRLTRFDVGRIPHVRIYKPGDGPPVFLPEAERAQRVNRGENVKIRTGLFMDPTKSTAGRLRRLEGDIKAQHNERVRQESRKSMYHSTMGDPFDAAEQATRTWKGPTFHVGTLRAALDRAGAHCRSNTFVRVDMNTGERTTEKACDSTHSLLRIRPKFNNPKGSFRRPDIDQGSGWEIPEKSDAIIYSNVAEHHGSRSIALPGPRQAKQEAKIELPHSLVAEHGKAGTWAPACGPRCIHERAVEKLVARETKKSLYHSSVEPFNPASYNKPDKDFKDFHVGTLRAALDRASDVCADMRGENEDCGKSHSLFRVRAKFNRPSGSFKHPDQDQVFGWEIPHGKDAVIYRNDHEHPGSRSVALAGAWRTRAEAKIELPHHIVVEHEGRGGSPNGWPGACPPRCIHERAVEKLVKQNALP